MNHRVNLVGCMGIALCLSAGSLSGMQGQEQNFFKMSKDSLKRLVQDTKDGSAKAKDFEQGFEVFSTFSQNHGFSQAIADLRADIKQAIEENSSESLKHMGKTGGYFAEGLLLSLSGIVGVAPFLALMAEGMARSGGSSYADAAAQGIRAFIVTACVAIAYGIKKCGWDAQIISTLRARNDELKKIAAILTNEKLEEAAPEEPQAETAK